jgi:hypothetical protein
LYSAEGESGEAEEDGRNRPVWSEQCERGDPAFIRNFKNAL